MPHPHLRSWLTFVLPPLLDLVSLFLTLFPFQSHNSSSFLPCLILIKILSWSLVLLTDISMSSHFFWYFDKETDFPHKSTSFTYPPHPLGTEVTPGRLLLLLWTLQSSLQPVPTSFLAESSLWPNTLLTSPTTPMLNEPHTMLFTHAFYLHLNLQPNFYFPHIQPHLILHCIQRCQNDDFLQRWLCCLQARW